MKRFGNFAFKYRYLFGFLIILIAIVFNVNGSSVGMWNEAFGRPDNHVILGTPRAIRTDEWRILTPMTVSQTIKSGTTGKTFSWFSTLIRGTETDVFMVYALPVLTPFIIFRPFLTGYLFLGASRGLAFFWAARLVFLWLSSAELFMLISKRKGLSAIAATLIAFSPVIQWWFAVNSFVEMIIAGNYAIVVFDRYLTTHDTRKRALYAFAIAWCAGVFGLSLYPAWMVPLAYVYLALAIWVLSSHFGFAKIKKTDILTAILAGIVLTVSLVIIAYISKETILSVAETVYPGRRVETGGGMWIENFYYVFNAFYPSVGYFGSKNACETSAFMSFFPMGIIMGISDVVIRVGRKVKQDLLVILMLALSGLLLIYCGLGFPRLLAKITLFSQSPAYRCIAIIGFVEIILVARSIANGFASDFFKKKPAVSAVVSFVIAIMAVAGGYICTEGYLGKKRCIIMCLVLAMIFFGMLNFEKFGKLAGVVMVGLVLCAGATVNPVQKGLSTIYESELSGMIEKVVAEDPQALWAVDNMNNEMVNYPIMMGAPTVNSVNTYPVLERWSTIDKDKAYADVYNRYANIAISIVGDDEGTNFELIAADNFKVSMTPDDIKTLGIDYILTDRELENYSQEDISFVLVGIDETDRRADNPDARYRIYKAERNSR